MRFESDLSQIHAVISDEFRFTSYDFKTSLTIDGELFAESGYCSPLSLLNEEQVMMLKADLETISSSEYTSDPRFYEYNKNESADPSRTLFHALGAWRISPAFHDLVFFGPLVKAAEQLLGGPVRFWHDQLFVKPPYEGGVVAWHQDYSYWTRTQPVAHLTCWVALDDSVVENGCLQYVPGSHRWNLLPKGELANNMEAIFKVLPDQQKREFEPVAIELKAGQASFYHPLLVHGSYENDSDHPRRGAVINFILDGVVSDTDEPLLRGVPIIPKGERLAGRFFPLLSQNDEKR